MRILNGPDRSTLARTREPEQGADEGAEIIDLVQLPIGARPMPRVELEPEEVDDARALDCENYNGCLAVAAQAKWPGFHCRRCPTFDRILAEPREARRMRMALQEQTDAARPLAPVIRLR